MSWDTLNPRSWYTLHMIAKSQTAARLEGVLAERWRHWRPVGVAQEAPAEVVELRIPLSATGAGPATHLGGSGPMEAAAIEALTSVLEAMTAGDGAAIVTTLAGAAFWNSVDGFGASGQATFDDCAAMFDPPLKVIQPED